GVRYAERAPGPLPQVEAVEPAGTAPTAAEGGEARLGGPPAPEQHGAVAAGGAPHPTASQGNPGKAGEDHQQPEHHEQRHAAAVHPRSPIRSRRVSTCAVSPSLLVMRSRTATGAVSGEIHRWTQRLSAPGSR